MRDIAKTASEAGGGFVTYLITFLEGIITFVSPCLLPMIPIYVTYFAAGEEVRTSIVLRNCLGSCWGSPACSSPWALWPHR